jgi:hypothetical protein
MYGLFDIDTGGTDAGVGAVELAAEVELSVHTFLVDFEDCVSFAVVGCGILLFYDASACLLQDVVVEVREGILDVGRKSLNFPRCGNHVDPINLLMTEPSKDGQRSEEKNYEFAECSDRGTTRSI